MPNAKKLTKKAIRQKERAYAALEALTQGDRPTGKEMYAAAELGWLEISEKGTKALHQRVKQPLYSRIV